MKRKLIFSLFDQVIVSGGNFLTLIICANILSVLEQGKFSYVLICYLGAVLFNVSSVFNGASVLVNEHNNTQRYEAALFSYQLISAVFISLIIGIILYYFGPYIDWHLTSTELALTLLFMFSQQIADYDRRIRYIFESEKNALIASLRLYPVRIVLLLLFAPDTLVEVLNILIIANIPEMFVMGLILFRKVIRNIDKETKNIVIIHLRFSKLLILSSLFGWLWGYLPVFALGAMHGKSAVAVLVTVRGITNVANVLMEQVETVASVVFAKTAYVSGANHLDKQVVNLVATGAIIWGFGICLLYFYGEEIILLLLGPKYATYSLLLLITWVAYGIYFIGRVFSIKYRSLKKQNIELITGASALLAALMSMPVIYYYKENGAAITYVIIALFSLFVQNYAVRRL